MIEIPISKANLLKLLNTLRKEDENELIAIYGDSYKRKFINICLKIKNYIYFLADDKSNPIAIGGAVQRKINNVNCAQVWLISSIYSLNYSFSLAKYISHKIAFFKNKFDVLFNYIYKSNFESIVWLKKFNFSFHSCNDINYKLFYFINGGVNFDFRCFAG